MVLRSYTLHCRHSKCLVNSDKEDLSTFFRCFLSVQVCSCKDQRCCFEKSNPVKFNKTKSYCLLWFVLVRCTLYNAVQYRYSVTVSDQVNQLNCQTANLTLDPWSSLTWSRLTLPELLGRVTEWQSRQSWQSGRVAEWQSGRVAELAKWQSFISNSARTLSAEWQSGRVGRVIRMPRWYSGRYALFWFSLCLRPCFNSKDF